MPTYQWKRNGSNIAQTGNDLSGIPVVGADAGDFSVVVTAGAATWTSSAVELDVITTPAANTTAGLTDPITLPVVVSGTGPFTYQWKKWNGSAYVNVTLGLQGSGADLSLTGNDLTITGGTAAEKGEYVVVVTNGTATCTSKKYTLN